MQVPKPLRTEQRPSSDSRDANGSRALVRIERATKTFRTPEGGAVTALDDVSLAVRSNEFITLLGPSGCGKTTLLRAVSGFEDLDRGEVFIDDVPMRRTPPYRRPVNTVFQSYALFPHLTVGENVGYSLDVAGVKRTERKRRVAEALALVDLVGLDRRMPRQLSGGQQQRVALARALINRPKLLLLDEPLSALDRQLRQSMQLELKNLQHSLGITFLFVTHDQEEALTMSDRIAVLDEGAIRQIGTPTEIYDRPATRFVAEFIGISNVFSGHVAEQTAAGCRITTANGLNLWAAAPGAAVGEAVDLLLRPEQLALHPGDTPAGSAFIDGTLEQVVFLGADLQIIARMADGRQIRALHRHGPPSAMPRLEPGAGIRFHYAAAAAHLIPPRGQGTATR